MDEVSNNAAGLSSGLACIKRAPEMAEVELI
jgi:hypothetical protein